MEKLKSYRELLAWQKAMDLVVAVYEVAGKLPSDERYGLKSQLQRAAVSIPANIAEGYGRTHRGDYLHHISIATGSLAELETHLTLVVRLNLIERDDVLVVWELAQEAGKLLRGLQESLRNQK